MQKTHALDFRPAERKNQHKARPKRVVTKLNHARSNRTYPVNVVPEDVGVDHGDGFQGHERDEANYPRNYERDVLLQQTERQPVSASTTITYYYTALQLE